MSNEIINYLNKFNLSNIQKPISLTEELKGFDGNNPLPFKVWLNQHTSISSGNEYKEYNVYLRKWYAYKDTEKSDQLVRLRGDYVNFLRELSILFKDDPNFKYISDIDFDDNLDIEYAIPYFTKKIKEICIYIINKRESAKTAKLKYNMAGSNQAIEKLFYQYLLQAFTQRNSLIQVPEFSGVELLPALSAVSNSFNIYVEELNDDSSNFDKDPSVTNYDNMPLSSYFTDLGYSPSSYDWFFNTGVMPLCSDNPFFWTLEQSLNEYDVTNTSFMPYSSVDLTNQINPNPNEVHEVGLSRKYLGNDFYLLTGGYYELKIQDFDLEITPFNNWFFWPTGEALHETYNTPSFDDIKINDTSLIESGATYSNDYREADKIFIQKEAEVLGAWLRHYKNLTETREMTCAIAANRSIEFKFPFCGFGIIGDGTSWTGRGISNVDSLYDTLDDVSKQNVYNVYWDYTTESEQICAIEVNETTLVDDGAFASLYYDGADKMSKKTATNPNKFNDSTPDAVYNDGYEYAWLYKFLKTDLPIKQGINNIQWPIQRIIDSDTNFLKLDDTVCAPMALSSISSNVFLGSRAGYLLGDSDIIYKLNSKGGYPIECAYLRGYDISESLPNTLVTGLTETTYVSSVTGVMQTGLTIKGKPDNPETFIWQDEDTLLNSLGLRYHQHQDDCPFLLYTKHKSLYDQKDVDEFEFQYPWKDCECKAVLFSPIGHIGEEYDDYGGMADIIIVDTQDPIAYSLSDWRGLDGKGYKTSNDFAWYKISKTETSNEQGLDVDVGMGVGSWVTGSGQPFTLKQGKQYKYIRTGMRRTYDELLTEIIPPIVISHLYSHTYKPFWVKAKLNKDGEWVETSEISDMVLKSGDYLYYDHFQSNFYCLLYNGTLSEGTTEDYKLSAINTSDNFWVNFTYATTGVAIEYKWPDVVYNGTSLNVPQTNTPASELSAVRWQVLFDSNLYTSNLSPEQELTVISYKPAEIRVSVSGYHINGITEVIDMSPVTIVAPQKTTTNYVSGEKFIQTIYSDTLNYMLNVPLSGWNYDEFKYDGVSEGAKPFWGQAVDDGTYTTKFKGVREWGYGLRVADEYTFIHQPKISFLSLGVDDTIKYEKKNTAILWKQPVEFIVNDETKEWCDLIIDPEKTSPLSSYLNNADKELVVYPTSSKSTLTLSQDDFIGYWSNSKFTWTQRLTDSSVGIPPFGGTYVPFASSLLIDADVPYANLTNRHYPTIATYPNALKFYSDRDSGGYFNYKGLGVLTYMSKGYFNTINPELTANNLNPEDLIFRDPTVFASNDLGLTTKVQSGPIRNVSNDSSWMKAKMTESGKAGSVVGENNYKEFSPYQTKEETVGKNSGGLINIDYALDPWSDKFDNKWRDTINWPPNFRKEYPISKWNYALNLFIKNQATNLYDKTITLEAPYFCTDNESRNVIIKEFDNVFCLGASIQGPITSFTNVGVLTTLTADVTSDGGVILQVNGDYLKNSYLPVYKGTDVQGASADITKILYGEKRDDVKSVSFGMLSIEVNNETFYTPIYKSKRTNCEFSNLSGSYNLTDTFLSYGYMPVYINEVEKGFIRLYTLV